jgi:hypothetical protein
MKIARYKGRYWCILDADGTLIVVTIYKKGALEVLRRLGNLSVPPNTPAQTLGQPES